LQNELSLANTVLWRQLSLTSPKGHKATIFYLVAKEYISVFQLISLSPPHPSLYCCSRDNIATNISYINASSTLICSR